MSRMRSLAILIRTSSAIWRHTPDEIRAILLTHWHNDHPAGAAAIHRLNRAPVYYHRGDLAQFSGQGGARGVRRWISDRIPEMGVLVLAKGLLGESVPEPVMAQHFVEDGEIVLDDFEVIATPGHTPGHVAYFYRPEGALFAGDALAVIDGRIRFMARPVTMDLDAARHSMLECLSRDPRVVCPGHRAPLTVGSTSPACGWGRGSALVTDGRSSRTPALPLPIRRRA